MDLAHVIVGPRSERTRIQFPHCTRTEEHPGSQVRNCALGREKRTRIIGKTAVCIPHGRRDGMDASDPIPDNRITWEDDNRSWIEAVEPNDSWCKRFSRGFTAHPD